MSILLFTIFIWLGAIIAGLVGSLTGLGGGIVIIPLLTIVFGVDIRYAIGASLVSVIATSSGAAAAYVKEGFSNIRIGMFLEIATTVGALVGAFLALRLATPTIAVIFGLVLMYSAYISSRAKNENPCLDKPDRLAVILKMNGTYPTPAGLKSYNVCSIPLGFSLMFIAGIISGLLGIGSGAVKVLAMDQAMRLPFKVSTATSNFMIGVTAAASAGIYLNKGYIDPGLTMPVMLGVLLGSSLGARHLFGAETKKLRIIFGLVIFILALEMIYSGLKGGLLK
ncbi:MAG: sulfite exporter TauE/SafE family protein [Candidatus Omnitrophica bacterium]|nr:sulfite exporter TauE/SafE family protein [Candidatus Omnitrophota bacterium]